VSDWSRRRGLGARLLAAQALVILAGSATLLTLALTLAPGLFRAHLRRYAGPVPPELAGHIDQAFARAVVLTLLLAMAAAALTALAVSYLVTRRVVRPVAAMAAAAQRIAAGRYDVRVSPSGLGAEFEALGRSFDEMAAALAATERVRTDLLRDVAHELRTPISTIRVYVEGLADGVLSPDARTAETLDGELDRMQRLVADLDKVSRAEERQLDLRLVPVVVTDLVIAAVEVARPAFTAKGVELTADPQPCGARVLADADRLHEVLTNLLDNALRHTPAGGRVTVAIRRRGDEVEVVVRDNGEGISSDQVRRVFERFYRVDAGRSRGRGGSGIGLTIARALVEVHGGRIRAESAGPGQGAAFTVTLPVAADRDTALRR
jgi:two-component system sensor histidine kinase BaeS